jgi:cyclin-dependent kinase 10
MYITFKTGKRSDEHDDRGPHEAGPDPSAPVTRRGVLTSFLTGKPMDIPEHDVVCTFKLIVLSALFCQ